MAAMEKLFSTQDVSTSNRFDYWHEIACKIILEHDAQPHCRLKFGAALQTAKLDNVSLVLFRSSAMEVVRSRRHIERATGDELLICHQLRGSMALQQCGRDVFLGAGEFVVIDPMLPYVAKLPSSSRMLLLKVPRQALEARIGRTANVIALSVKPSDPEGSLASSYLDMLPTYAGRISLTASEMVRDQALDLVAVALIRAIGAHKMGPTSDAEAPSSINLSVPLAVQTDTQTGHFETAADWSKADLFFLADSLLHGRPISEVAGFLGRDQSEVHAKARTVKLTK
jgi:hypothetical protein